MLRQTHTHSAFPLPLDKTHRGRELKSCEHLSIVRVDGEKKEETFSTSKNEVYAIHSRRS